MAPRIAVFVTDTLPPRAKEILTGYEVFESQADDQTLARCQALICWPSRVKADLLGKMKSLRIVQTMSAGVDGLDFASLPPDVQVFSNAGAFTESVAEHAWGLLLGAAKGVHLRNQKATPRRLRAKTLMVLGAGSIGSEVARLAKSIGMKTIGISRSFRSPELFDERYPVSALAEKIPEADAVVMALPLTKGTMGLMNYEVLSRSKEDVVIVNLGRGESVTEEGLIRWLKERPESRFATDVFWRKGGRESFDTQAWDLPNFAGTLHVSGVPSGDDLSGPKVAAAWNVKRYFESGSALNHIEIGEYV
ncbi:MAG: 3-phosphoglycerate dehydrogenase [Thaumarchaeota archaeon]|nr:3-phosphoglycerate dehydrogenase [Nitrososphaerota archaeon]